MMDQLQDRAKEFVQQNATTILTAAGVVGTVATAVLAGRAGYKYHELVELEDDHRRRANQQQVELQGDDAIQQQPLGKLEKIQLAGVYFVPPVFTGAATIAAIIFSHKMSAQKAAALAAAYGLSQRQFEEYKNKVAEKLTGPKNQAIKDELAQDRVDRASGYDKIVIVDGNDVLCFDSCTGRYFRSSMEKVTRAANAVNLEIHSHGSARASMFYDELELPPTTWSNDVGWNLDSMLELDISTTQAPDGRPCLVIDFKRLPIEDYQRSLYK